MRVKRLAGKNVDEINHSVSTGVKK